MAVLIFAGCAGGGDQEVVTVTSARQETVTVSQTETVTETASDESTSVPELISKVENGIVRIDTENCAGEPGGGTGFLLAPDLVATVEHVVDDAARIVLTKEGDVVSDHARVLGADSYRDVALLKTDSHIEGHVFTLSEQEPKLGEEVAALGFPLSTDFPTFDVTVTRGTVSGLDRTVLIGDVERKQMVQTDAAINPGNSGGPLISLESGEVVAIADAVLRPAEGFSWGVNVEVAAPLIETWRQNPGTARARSLCSDEFEFPLKTFAGEYFSIGYPSSWDVEAGEITKGSYLDTTIRNPNNESMMIRVDVEPGRGDVDPLALASEVEEGLRPQPGYERIAFGRVDFQDYDAVWWEFVVEEEGVALHKVDIFFVSESGHAFAVLTQAPAAEYEDWSSLFDEIRRTLLVESP